MDEVQVFSIAAASFGVAVATVYYALTLRTTNRTRQAQLFMGIYNRIIDPEFMDLYIDLMNIEWKDVDEGCKKIIDPERYKSFLRVSGFFEGIGVLIREKLVNQRLVALLMTGLARRYWEKLAPVVMQLRKEFSYPRLDSETEFLYNALMRYTDKHPELKS